MTEQESLIAKIKELPPEMCAEIATYLDSVLYRRNLAAKEARAQAIAAYAAQNAGSDADLDIELEAAAMEHLLSNTDQ